MTFWEFYGQHPVLGFISLVTVVIPTWMVLHAGVALAANVAKTLVERKYPLPPVEEEDPEEEEEEDDDEE